jgi:hypothetical protein
MDKLDLRKQYKHLYSPSAKLASIVDVPALQFVMVSGAIEPGCSPGNSPSFSAAIQALYSISYTLKFMSKQRPQGPLDYGVSCLEALWWVEDGHFEISRPDNWFWTAMILQPDHINAKMLQEGLEKLRQKKDNPVLGRVTLEIIQEGLCVQMMHLGPYSTEPATVEKMKAFAEQSGFTLLPGKHHEIYLSDPGRTEPSRMKTVLRHPVV